MRPVTRLTFLCFLVANGGLTVGFDDELMQFSTDELVETDAALFPDFGEVRVPVTNLTSNTPTLPSTLFSRCPLAEKKHRNTKSLTELEFHPLVRKFAYIPNSFDTTLDADQLSNLGAESRPNIERSKNY